MPAVHGCGPGGVTDPEALRGTWVVEHLPETGDPLLAVSEISIRLTFEDGRVGGTGGVNRFRTTFESSDDGTIAFGPIAATRMAGPESAMRRESAFFGAIGRAARFEVSEGRLVLRDREDRILLVLAAT